MKWSAVNRQEPHATRFRAFTVSYFSEISSEVDEGFCLAAAWGMIVKALSVRPYKGYISSLGLYEEQRTGTQ